MRISDWSSDVCSSDLVEQRALSGVGRADDHRVQAVPQLAAALGVCEQRGEQFDGGVQALAQRAATEGDERVVAEIDRGLRLHALRKQFGAEASDAAPALPDLNGGGEGNRWEHQECLCG